MPDRRPQILFERHIFHRLTDGKFDDGQISDPAAGGYGARGAAQYDRLALALAKDADAALQSASWGIGQIMGMNYDKSFVEVDLRAPTQPAIFSIRVQQGCEVD